MTRVCSRFPAPIRNADHPRAQESSGRKASDPVTLLVVIEISRKRTPSQPVTSSYFSDGSEDRAGDVEFRVVCD